MSRENEQASPTELERLKASLLSDIEVLKKSLQVELEQEKHRLAVQRDVESRASRHSEVVYQELGHHMRSLNTFLWQVPGLVIAITGGLWFGAASIDNVLAKRVALGYTAAVDFAMIFVVVRMRTLFQRNLAYQLRYEAQVPQGPSAASQWKFVVVVIWIVLLLGAGVISVLGAVVPELVSRTGSLVTNPDTDNSRSATPGVSRDLQAPDVKSPRTGKGRGKD